MSANGIGRSSLQSPMVHMRTFICERLPGSADLTETAQGRDGEEAIRYAMDKKYSDIDLTDH